MDAHTVWREFFQNWPKGLPRTGVLVTNYDEQVPFAGFMTSDTMLLIERRAPDTIGARKVLVPYGNVLAIKLVEVARAKVFQASGFAGELPNE